MHCQAPLNSDIEALSESLKSGTEEPQWYRTTQTVDDIVDDACDAVAAAGRGVGQISTLILPADVSWADGAPEARKADIASLEKMTANIKRQAQAPVEEVNIKLTEPSMPEESRSAALGSVPEESGGSRAASYLEAARDQHQPHASTIALG